MILKTEGAFGDYDLDEESLLAIKAKKEREAIAELWKRMYKLVVSICNNFYMKNAYARQRCELDDLIQESYLFFEEAIQKYDFSRGAKFSTFLCFYIKKACNSVVGDIPQISVRKEQGKTAEKVYVKLLSIDAPIKDGEDTTLGETIPDETSGEGNAQIETDEAVKLILEQVAKVRGGMNRYCFLEYAYRNQPMIKIAKKVKVSQSAISHHVFSAAAQLRDNPIIKATYPERYERTQYYLPDHSVKGVSAFRSSGLSIVEDIVNRRLSVDEHFNAKPRGNIKHEEKK